MRQAGRVMQTDHWSEGILRSGLLNGISLWMLKSFGMLATNGVENETLSQEPKSA